ncbi:MAG: hypothetical protein ABEL04_08655 [Salinibacter sp.]|uniref:hypothetical protein n=1 Tax=Salinibacter sp. TaxID=2065818 RepID=UPI0035D500C0
MAQDFNFSEHLSEVFWQETLWHNALRGVGAGIVWGTLMLFTDNVGEALRMMVMLPVAYLLFFLPVGLLAAWLSSMSVPLVGLIAAFFSLIVAVGDPLVYALSKFRPEWVPVDRPDFFSLRIVIFVLSPFAE